jgi:ribonuclease P protein component
MRGPGHKRRERTSSGRACKTAWERSWGGSDCRVARGAGLLPWYTRGATPSGSAAPRAPPTRSLSQGDSYQADVPTQEALPAQDPWVSHTHVDARGSPGAEGEAPQGSQAPDAGSDAMNRRHRLSGRRRIAAVRETGSEGRSGVVRVRAVANDRAVTRVAFAVPGAGGAVCRNRARRRLRAAIAPLLAECPRLDVIVSLPGHATEIPFSQLRSALASALGAAGRSVQAPA